MGFMHIDNLYKNQKILEFPECYALEKIHGTSAWIYWTPIQGLGFHPGGETINTFKPLFNEQNLDTEFRLLYETSVQQLVPFDRVVVHGEAYGGKQQKNQWRYGPVLKFIGFDVKYERKESVEWLKVPLAQMVCEDLLGLEFVHYKRITTKLSDIDAERDAISEQAIRNGVTTRDGDFIRREGVVLRTIDEVLDHRGNRIMAKHKRAEERETKTERKVDTNKVEVLKEARAIAEEWVVPERLNHVLSHVGGEFADMTRTKEVIAEMIRDVNREGAGEFEPSNTVNAEIGKRTAQLLKQYLENRLHET